MKERILLLLLVSVKATLEVANRMAYEAGETITAQTLFIFQAI